LIQGFLYFNDLIEKMGKKTSAEIAFLIYFSLINKK